MPINNFLKKTAQMTLFWPIVVLGLITIFNIIFVNGFTHLGWRDGHLTGLPIDILNRSTHIMVVAIGMTLVIATRGIDVSVGAIVAITGAMAAYLVGGQLIIDGDKQILVTGAPLYIAILAALGIGLLCGLWNGFLVSKLGIQPIVATLILMVAGRGIAQLIASGQIITIYYTPYHFIGNGFLLGLPFPLFLAGALLLLTLLLVRKTALGMFIESIGINPKASHFSGVNSKLILVLVYVFCGFCCAISGLLVTSNVKSADGNNAGLMFEMDAVLAVVLGGTSMAGGKFTLLGSVIGALILQSLTTCIYALGVPPEINMLIKALVVFIVSLIQSENFRTFILRPFRNLGRQSV